jgi:flagellar hook-associated protein 3 FlgL
MSAFRITQTTLASRALADLQDSLARTQKLQDEMSSGKQLQRPSDGPADTAQALNYRSGLKRLDQYGRNAQDGLGWLGTADTALTNSLDLLSRVRELVLQGTNAASGPQDRAAMAAEVDTLKQGLLGLANSQYENRPVFAGTANASLAYDAAGAYQGDTGAVSRTVAAGVGVQVNLTGPEVFGAGPSNAFAVLDQIAADLRDGSPAAIAQLGSTDLGSLDAARVTVQNKLAEVGARYHRVEMMQTRAQDATQTMTSALSEIEDVDLPKTIMSLQLQQVSYQSALAATARVIQPSLLDFIK